LFDEPVDGRGEAVGVEPGQRRAGPLVEGAVDVADVEVLLEAQDVDRVGGEVQAVGGVDPCDRVVAERRTESGDVGLEGLVGRPRWVGCPDQLDDACHGHGGACRERPRRAHGPALGRAEIDRASRVGGVDATEQSDLHHHVGLAHVADTSIIADPW
jgi:hypothetical protein